MRSHAYAFGLTLALAGGAACHWVAGLERPVEGRDAGPVVALDAAREAEVDAGPPTWCTTQRDEPDGGRGRIVFCNDFDRGGAAFGFEELRPAEGIEFALESFAASPPNALGARLAADAGKPLTFGVKNLNVPADQLSVSFDVSFGAEGGFSDASTESAVTLAGIRFENGTVVVLGIHERETLISYIDNLLKIDIGDLVDRAQVVGGGFRLGYRYSTVDVRVRRGVPPCHPTVTKYIGPDGGEPDSSAPVHVAFYAASLALRCAILPDIPSGSTSTLLVGGFVSKPRDSAEWRFDNVIVRAVD